jgi:hypothetical protein
MAGEIVTSCPLCLALSDPADMLDFEIERTVPKGRAHVQICRLCGSQVVRAMAQAGEPLARELIDADKTAAEPKPEISRVAPVGAPVTESEKETNGAPITTGNAKEDEPDA